MISLFRNTPKSYKTTQMLYQSLTGFSALRKLVNREDLMCMDFKKKVSKDNYLFDYYSANYKIALQVDAHTGVEEDVYNMEGIKMFKIPSLGITVLKISDYQLLTDLDEIARRLRLCIQPIN